MLTNPLRPAILAAARSSGVERAITRVPITKRLVDRFVSGPNRGDVIGAVERMLATGRAVSVDFLGEYTTDVGTARATVQEYLELIADLPHETHRVEVSLKLSALGRGLLPNGTAIAAENARTVCAAAQAAGIWVTVDAEDHTTTDSTLAIVEALRVDYPWLGVVLQSYLRRTEQDCRELSGAGSRVRLCKGAYREPASVAFQDKHDVDASYSRCLEILFAGNGYPMVASHDPAMIAAVDPLVGGRSSARSRGAGDYEHQMLFGVRDVEQQRLVSEGRQVRVYVPYGTEWYGYFMRRLAERPSNLRFFLRSVIADH